MTTPSVTVAVISICGASRLARCLDALAAQREAPPFDIMVVFDPRLADLPALAAQYPEVRFICNEGQTSPLQLVPRALREARGELILLTKDHCAPAPDWVRRHHEAQAPGRAVVGGIVEPDPAARGVDWAAYFVDFYRYAAARSAGPSPTLTVCNASYRREQLAPVRPTWDSYFVETSVNAAIAGQFGQLWLTPDARVTLRRRVRLRDAARERFAFGRSFGASRLEHASPMRRASYALAGPIVPVLLLARMSRTAISHSRLTAPFVRALPAVVILVCAWALGEWIGTLTRRPPSDFTIAPDLDAG